ncbi:LysR family transcriptional regulator [Lapillicoccus jejuensis]|uniref:DNA-binding transcriptional LysR family regulator n=1 Tax=Lapillicoccus jejuensis TaxID=402171 RepID=A0A542E1B1_9MICO|nr:LysR family transcriptional regulator [Lapillicoccus jejuensis]TQJ09127.1 DNA-binding transcriptional LysR family regulator [Lapillicoccus jejuensis]
MLDLHRLRVFRAVVATGSVGGAATALGYSPSAVSQHVTALQRETGLALLEKHGRGIVPTDAGRRLAHESESVLDRLAELESVAADLRAGRSGRLTFAYVASAGTAWVPPVVATLDREFPDLRLDLRLVELDDGRLDPDLEVVVEQAVGPRDAETEVLLEEPYVVAVPTGHRFAGRDEVALAELDGERWVDNDVVQGPCRQVVLDACAAAGIVPGFHVEAHDYPSALAFVAVGVGVTVLPRLGTVTMPDGVVAVPLAEPAPRRRLVLRTRPSLREHPAVRRASELLRAAAARTTAT